MKIQRRLTVIGGTMLIIMFFAGLGIGEAFGGRMFRCGPHFGPFGGDMHGFVLKRLDRKIKELNLTAAQQTRYDELRAQLKERLLAAKEDRKKFRETVHTELAKESPDVAVLTAMTKKKIDGVSGALQDGLDLFADFYSTLDQDQKKKVLSGIRKRMAAQDACREERQ
jgi:hypothetical protein